MTVPPLTPATIAERPARSLRFWLAAVGVFMVCGALRFWYFYLDDLTRRHPGTFGRRLLEESTGSLTALLCFVGVVWLHDHLPLSRATWQRRLPLYVPGFALYTTVHTSLMWATRTVLSPLVGLGPYDYGVFPTRFFMEAGEDAIAFSAFIIALNLVDSYRARREGERREQELERHFVQAQLQSLRLQLQPHFLFNALNTISQVMYDDPAAADEMIGHLAELLRQAIRTIHRQEVALGEELALLDHYVALMRARFGEDLVILVEASADARGALVPSLLLQPLVENAVRHGNAMRHGRGRVEVRAVRAGDRLHLDIVDDGDGDHEGESAGNGLGLSATAERLALLYGTESSFATGPRPSGGFGVAIRIPFRAAPTVEETDAVSSREGAPALAGAPHARSPR